MAEQRQRVVLVNQFFHPEPNELRGLEFARDLAERGCHVEVLTGFPNYPAGTIYDGYRMRPYQREDVDGIAIHRVAHYVSHDMSQTRRFLSYATLMLSASLFLLAHRKRYDVVWVQQGPATLGAAAVLWRMIGSGRFVLDVQDVWPDSVTSSPMLKSRRLVAPLTRFSSAIASRADAVVTLSNGASERLIALGVEPSRIRVVANWTSERSPSDGEVAFAKQILADCDQSCAIAYVGTFGPMQDLRTVVEAAALVADETSDVVFVLAGDGPEHAKVKTMVAQRGIPNVVLPGRVSQGVGTALLQNATASLLHLRESPLSATAVPSKLASYLYAGRPCVVAAEGAVVDLAERSGAAMVLGSLDPRSLADAVLAIAAMPTEQTAEIGAQGRAFYDANLSYSRGLERLAAVARGL